MEFLEAPAFTRYVSGYSWVCPTKLPKSSCSGDNVSSGKGRRGGLRVIYYYFPGERQIWLITVYDKDEASDLTPKERQALKSASEIELRARQAAKQRKSRR